MSLLSCDQFGSKIIMRKLHWIFFVFYYILSRHPFISEAYNYPKSILSLPSHAKTITPTKSEILFYGKFMAVYYCSELEPKLINACKAWKDSVTSYRMITNNETNTKALVALLSNKKDIVVSFRGTTGLQDSILDITVFAFPTSKGCKACKIHEGFYLATKSISDKVVEEVNKILEANPKVNKLSLTGLSLGGSMASIALFLFKTETPFIRKLTYTLLTFAQPRVGNVAFARYLNNLEMKMGRVVTKADIVPHLPPVSVAGMKLFFDYYVHHAQEIWITGQELDSLRICSNELLEDPQCSNSLPNHEYTPDHHLLSIQYVFGGNGSYVNKSPFRMSTFS